MIFSSFKKGLDQKKKQKQKPKQKQKKSGARNFSSGSLQTFDFVWIEFPRRFVTVSFVIIYWLFSIILVF